MQVEHWVHWNPETRNNCSNDVKSFMYNVGINFAPGTTIESASTRVGGILACCLTVLCKSVDTPADMDPLPLIPLSPEVFVQPYAQRLLQGRRALGYILYVPGAAGFEDSELTEMPKNGSKNHVFGPEPVDGTNKLAVYQAIKKKLALVGGRVFPSNHLAR
ncbi:hypothetical protein J6590_033311 [Homalodisca vitripennis]|nr:hypothetical protein J6590_033311 [Homalodisca vitripennis]